VKVTVEKLDDVNFIMRGSVENSVIEEKVKQLKEEAKKENSKEETKVEQDAAGEVFKEFIQAGVKEANIEPDSLLGQPALKKYEQQENSIYFEVELSVSPKINVDVDLSDVIPTFTKPIADSEEVEKKLADFVDKQAPFQAIEKPKAVENGDVAVIDFKGLIDGKSFEGGTAHKFNLKIGSNSFIEGFEEQLIGMEYGDEREVTLNFPKDYQAEDLAGKEAKFIVKLHEIQEQTAQAPDDAFAKKILSDETATLDTLKEKLGDQITSDEVSKIYMSELKPKMVEGLLSKFDFILPNNIVEQEIDAKVSEKSRMFSEEEHAIYKENKGKFMELRESLRKEAQDSIKKTLIVEALAKKEGIDVHEQEVHAALAYQAMITGQDATELVKYYEENNLMVSAKMGLTEDKLFGKMLGFDKN